MIRMKCVLQAVCLLAVAACSISVRAQETSGSISGTVTDSTGAAVKGATVILTNTDRGHDERVLKTNVEGFYTATSLPLGTYTVKVEDGGFKSEAVTGVVLHSSDALTVNRKLVVGSSSEVITVTADKVQLNFEDATSAGLISGDQLNELTLNNRNYEQFLQLQPGVAYSGTTDQLSIGPTAPSGASGTVAFSVNGGRTTSNNWTVDGADNVDRGANLTLLVYPSIDAIAEVKTLRGQYSAEYGRSASAQVMVITKSGTNQIHGTAYEFFRNDAFNANTWLNKNIAGGPANFTPRSKLRYHDFGGSIGGPIVIPHLYNGRDRSFFFFSDEARRVIQYTSGTALVPTAAERAGDFSNEYYIPTGGSGWSAAATGPVNVCTAYNTTTGACTAIGTKVSNISPTAAAYLKDLYSVVPLPTSAIDIASNIDPHSLLSTARNQYNDNQIIVRIDQSIGSKLNVFYRYIHDTLPVISGTGTFTTVPLPGVANTTTKQPGTIQMGHGTYVFSPTMLLDMGYAYSRGAIETDPTGVLTTANSPDVKPILPYANQLGVIPTLGITGLTSLGSTGIYRDYNVNHQAFGSLTKTLGRHTVLAGMSYDHYQKKENATGGNQGSYSFAATPTLLTAGATATSIQAPQAFAQFLNGGVNGSFSQTSLAITPDIQENIFEGFVQDNWKILPRLTLNIGVRYSYFGQPIDAGGRLSNFDPTTYSAAKAPTISSTGLICFTGTCANADGLNSGAPNPGADYIGVNYINGMVFGTPSASNNNQASRFGSKVGQAGNANFAPRIGFAFDVFGDGKTALRGGFGWSYDQSEVSFYETAVFNNPPAVSTYSITTGSIDNPAGSTAAAASPSTTPGRLVASPVDYHTPYVEQFSLDIQQELTPTFMVDIGYFGTHGTHLLGLVDINEAQPGAYLNANGTYKVNPLDNPGCVYPGTTTPAFISTTCDRALNQIRPYLGYFSIDAVRSIFSSNYNALQVKATKRFSGKTFLDANYTWSRDLTNAQNDYSTPPQNTYNINADYGRAAVDRTNILVFDGAYEVPWLKEQKGYAGHILGGWELSGILQMYSGLPLTPSASAGGQVYYGYTNPINGQANGNTVSDTGGIGISGNTNASFRPDQIADPNNGYGRQIHNKNEWFYRGAFSTPLPGVIRPGNSKRGSITGPGFQKLDIGLFRNFKIHEGLDFQLRGEAFNVLNHTNLANPSTSSTSTAFASITAAAHDNRILQVAGKIRF
jgi:hypothetical protein